MADALHYQSSAAEAGIFRVVPGFVAQHEPNFSFPKMLITCPLSILRFGLPGKPQKRLENIPDDPVKAASATMLWSIMLLLPG